jgi:hypothetical protein
MYNKGIDRKYDISRCDARFARFARFAPFDLAGWLRYRLMYPRFGNAAGHHSDPNGLLGFAFVHESSLRFL